MAKEPKNVKTPSKARQGTRLRNFIGSGGKPENYETSKGLDKAINSKK